MNVGCDGTIKITGRGIGVFRQYRCLDLEFRIWGAILGTSWLTVNRARGICACDVEMYTLHWLWVVVSLDFSTEIMLKSTQYPH